MLGLVPTYCLSLFKAPIGILAKLESLRRNLFLGADIVDKKLSYIS